jgi:flagellar biosynthesis GTPase FlhF
MLSKWSILPHTEQMQSYMPLSANHKSDEKTASETRIFRNQEDREVQALFAKEERIGKEKKQLRREKQRLKNNAAMNTAQDKETMQQNESPVKSSSTNPRTPQVYNGPCVICLEPDLDSREKLQALGYLLQHTFSRGIVPLPICFDLTDWDPETQQAS